MLLLLCLTSIVLFLPYQLLQLDPHALQKLVRPLLTPATPTSSVTNEDSLGSNWGLLSKKIQKRVKTGHLVIVQVNFAFLDLALNLICSAMKHNIPKENFLIWSMDPKTHQILSELDILSFYNPVLFFGVENGEDYHSHNYNKMMRERVLFWKIMHSLNQPYWWFDADAVIHKPLGSALQVESSYSKADIIFQLDSHWRIDSKDFAVEAFNRTFKGLFRGLNPGIFFMKPTRGSKLYLDILADKLIEFPWLEEQQVIDRLARNGVLVYARNYTGASSDKPLVDLFDQAHFPNGHISFNDWYVGLLKDNLVYLTHLNGVGEKAKVLKDWKMWYFQGYDHHFLNCSI
jgi:hypothetical protein